MDWNIWFIGFKPHSAYLNRREGWLYELLAKLMSRDRIDQPRPWLNLLDSTSAKFLKENYDVHHKIPTYTKVDMYHYQMAAPLWEIIPQYIFGSKSSNQEEETCNVDNGQEMTCVVDGGGKSRIRWWNRTFEENLIPPVYLGENRRLVKAPF